MEDKFSEEVDSIDDIDNKFKVHKNVVVYFTLPSGQEEVLVDYDMCFVDKISYME